MDSNELSEKVRAQSSFVESLKEQMSKAVIGQQNMVENLLIGLLADGHVLLEGLPGLAKTTAVKGFADALGLDFKRIQFTPDLLPADLLGTQIYNSQTGAFEIKKGPLFSQIVLADEINRAPSKVQTALLEAMQEKQITLANQSFALAAPYMVLATQNPLEQEGTYPLPEAQIDRFMLKVLVEYPNHQEEIRILDAVSGEGLASALQVFDAAKILQVRETVKSIFIDDRIKDYIVRLVVATRNPGGVGLDKLTPLIEVGASPRASIDLAKAAKAHAFMEQRAFVTPEDVKSVAFAVLRHRIALSYEAEAEEMLADDILSQILNGVDVP